MVKQIENADKYFKDCFKLILSNSSRVCMSKEKVAFTVDRVAALIQENKELPEAEHISPLINNQTLCGDTLLITAIKHNPNAVIPLLDQKADPNQKNLYGKPPLHIMFDTNGANNYSHSQINIFKYLIKSKADINIVDNQNNSLFHLPYIQYFENIIIKILKQKDFNWKIKDKETEDSIFHQTFGKTINKNAILLNKLGTVDIINKKQETPLHQYCGNGKFDVEMIELLLHHKANPNLKTIEGETPLSLMLLKLIDNPNFIQINHCFYELMKFNSNINEMIPQIKVNKNIYSTEIEKTSRFEPIFHRILRILKFDFIPLAIDCGADINKKDSKGKTAIQKFKSNKQILSILKLSFNKNEKIIQLCKEIYENKELNINLYEKEILNGLNRSGDTPLISAIRYGSYLSIIPLLESKVDPNKKNIMGESPLFVLCDYKDDLYAMDHLEILKSLLEYKGDVNEINSNGLHVLECSYAGKNKQSIINEIIKQSNFNWNYQNIKNGNSFFHYNHFSNLFIECLLNVYKKTNLNDDFIDHINFLGESGLHTQCEHQNYSIIKLLIENNANINLRRKKDGETPFSLFILNQNVQSTIFYNRNDLFPIFFKQCNVDVNLNVPFVTKNYITGNLENNSSAYEPLFHRIIKTNQIELVKLALGSGADIYKKDSKGKHSLHKFKSNKELIHILTFQSNKDNSDSEIEKLTLQIQKNEKINFNSYHLHVLNEINKSGDTLLIIAIRFKNISSIISLLESKVDPNKKNLIGDTPLHILCQCNDSFYAYEHIHILKSLLQYNANVNEINSYFRFTSKKL